MTQLTLDLSPELYRRLRSKAERLGRPAQDVAQELLAEQLAQLEPTSTIERERVAAALIAAGLLTGLGPEEKRRADRTSVTLEDVRASLDKTGGKPLSEVILEMRGPKE